MTKYFLLTFTIILFVIMLLPVHYTSASYESINFQYENQQAGVLSSLLNLLSPTSNAQTPDITTGLVGYWTFDEGSGTTASDSSGNNNTGTLTGGPTWATGKIGGALSFDGVDDYIAIPGGSWVPNNKITVLAWIKVQENFGYFMGHIKSPVAQRNWYCWNNNGFLTCGFANSSLGSSNARILNAYNADWHQVGFTADLDADTMSYIIDGAIDKTGANTNSPATTLTHDVTIGQVEDATFANHFIDDVRIYDRVLTQAEITELYNYTGKTTPPPPPTCTSFTYTDWSPTTCPSNETQTRTVQASLPIACTGGTPITTQSCTYTPPASDTESPSTPTNLQATPPPASGSSSQINLSWTASTDDTAVTGYNIYRCTGASCTPTLITTVTGTSYSNTGLTAETTYTYTVSAYDAEGNTSSQSAQVNATTQSVSAGFIVPNIIQERPRMFVTQADIPELLSRVNPGGLMYDKYNSIKAWVDSYSLTDFDIDMVGIEDPNVWYAKRTAIKVALADQMNLLDSIAFVALVEKNNGSADLNIYSQMILKTSSNLHTLTIDQQDEWMHYYTPDIRGLSLAFDWMYDLFSPSEREAIIDYVLFAKERNNIKIYTATGPVPGVVKSVMGALWAAIAFSGESYRENDIQKVIEKYTKYYEAVYTTNMDIVGGNTGGSEQGFAYDSGAMGDAPVQLELYRVATGRDLYDKNSWVKNYFSWDQYSLRPDGWRLKEGRGSGFGIVHTSSLINALSFLASRSRDPYLQQLITDRFSSMHTATEWRFILGYDPDIPTKPLFEDLPLTKLFDGTEELIMRTGWNMGTYSQPSEDTYATLQSGNWAGAKSGRKQGGFMIYYKGELACEGGGHHTEVIHSNSIMIDEEDQLVGGTSNFEYDEYNLPTEEQIRTAFGEGTPSDLADIVKWKDGGDYVYALGDVSNAYNPAKLFLFTREFVFIKPNFFIVFDRVNTTNSSYSKKYLLHSINVPKIDSITPPDGTNIYTNDLIQIDRGGTTANGYPDLNGRLFSKTLLPINHTITVVGTGQTPDFDDEEPARWRIEIQPSTPQENDLFLHVMQVGDSDTLTSMTPTTLITADTMTGTLINDSTSPQIVLFSSDSQGADVTTVTYNATYPSSKTATHLLLDIQPGTYDIYKNSIKIHSDIGASTQGVLTFTSTGGSTFQITQTGTTPPPPTLQGDLNNDDTVNSLDWSIMNNVWNTNDATADINGDGIVNTIDWSVMNSNWSS